MEIRISNLCVYHSIDCGGFPFSALNILFMALTITHNKQGRYLYQSINCTEHITDCPSLINSDDAFVPSSQGPSFYSLTFPTVSNLITHHFVARLDFDIGIV